MLRAFSNQDILESSLTIICANNNQLFKIIQPSTPDKEIRGTEGTVKEALNLETNISCLVKERTATSSSTLADARKEVIISNFYRKGYIKGYKEFYDSKDDSHKTYMFMLKLPGITIEMLDQENLSSPDKIKILCNLLMELKKLSLKGINHNDINNSNILVDEHLNVYLIDFGRSSIRQRNNTVYGHDFDAMYEIIVEDLELLTSFPELQSSFDAKLTAAGNATQGFNYINIDDLIEKSKLAMRKVERLQDDSTQDSEEENNDTPVAKRFKT